MASASNLEVLDQLGPVLCRLECQRVNLTWQTDSQGRGYYFVDGRDADGNFFSGMGDVPSAALAAAQRDVAARGSGVYLDA